MTSTDETGRKYTPTKKAYKNESFINSSQVRNGVFAGGGGGRTRFLLAVLMCPLNTHPF